MKHSIVPLLHWCLRHHEKMTHTLCSLRPLVAAARLLQSFFQFGPFFLLSWPSTFATRTLTLKLPSRKKGATNVIRRGLCKHDFGGATRISLFARSVRCTVYRFCTAFRLAVETWTFSVYLFGCRRGDDALAVPPVLHQTISYNDE